MKKRLLCAVCVCLLSVGSGMAQTQRSMTVDQLFSQIESGSNVLTAQKTGVDVASRAVEEAKSKRLPDINASLSANIWYIGVGVKYSLSSLFKSNKSVRRAKEQLRLSNTAHSVAAETVNNNMQQAYTMHKQSFVELRTQQKSVELAQQNYQVVSNRYNNQLALITDMIDASNIKLNAELQEVNARINIAYTYYNVRYAAGNI